MNQTKFINSLNINSNLVFNSPSSSSPSTTDSSNQSEPSPPQQQTTIISKSINIIPTLSKPVEDNNNNSSLLLIDEQQQQNLKTNILNTCKVFRTSPLITQQQSSSSGGHILIQTLNKKPVLNHHHTKQLNTITLTTVQQQQPSSSSYPSASSRINLPITPIQLTSTSTTPSINKITKCSQSCTTSSTPSSSSPTLGSSTAAKLILNGSANYENQLPTTLKITTPRQQQILKTPPTMPKIVFSTTPIQIHQPPTPTTNLIIQPRFIITTTTTSSGTTNTSTLFSSSSSNNITTYSATPINLKTINSKLNETLAKTKIVDTKNFIKTTVPSSVLPQQQQRPTNLIESKLSIEEAQSSLIEFKNNLITQSLNLFSSSQPRSVITTPTPSTTTTSSFSSSSGSPTPSPVQHPSTTTNNILQSPSAKPNIIRKTKSKTDIELSLQSALNQIINNDQIQATKPNDTDHSSSDRQQQHKNHAKMIVNLTKASIDSNSSEQTVISNPSPTVTDLLQPAVLHIPCSNISPEQHQQTSTFVQTIVQQETPTKDRKRRINEFDSLIVKSEETTKIVDELQPLQKITRLNDSTSKFKTTLKKSKETFKSVDNLENIDLNVNKCTINVLDDETVKSLSKEFVYYDNYGIKWISKNTNPNSITLLKYYKPTWKTRSNHFTRYSDVKLKEETKTLNEMTIEKDRLKNLNEWTFHYIISQFKELMTFENESLNFMSEVENLLKTRINLTDKNIYETLKANSQRHIHVSEQLNEAHVLIQNIVKSKQKFVEILNRNPSSKSNTSTTTATPTTTTPGKSTKISSNNKKSLKSSNNKPTLFKHTLKNESKSSLMKSKLKNKE